MSAPLLWVHDPLGEDEFLARGLVSVLAVETTPYQRLVIGETARCGRALFLDDSLQSREDDEFLYHEPLVHLALLQAAAARPPRRVLVLGGGEGACLREILRWPCVERALMVDLDEAVVSACRRWMPSLAAGAWDDPRVELRIADAWDYAGSATETFDAIVADLTEPFEGGPACRLYTVEFYRRLIERLAPGGAFVTQAGPFAPTQIPALARLLATARAVWPEAALFHAAIPSFGVPWSFLLAGADPLRLDDPHALDQRLAAHGVTDLRMLDGRCAWSLLQLPRYAREALERPAVPFTLTDPPSIPRPAGPAVLQPGAPQPLPGDL